MAGGKGETTIHLNSSDYINKPVSVAANKCHARN